MTFAEKLKHLRVKNEYSQETLAQLLNVSRQAITKWENDNGMPDIENLKAIADIFGVTLDSLLREEENVESTEKSFFVIMALSGGVIGLVLGWLLREIAGVNMGAWGIGGTIIGYAIGYMFLLLKRKK